MIKKAYRPEVVVSVCMQVREKATRGVLAPQTVTALYKSLVPGAVRNLVYPRPRATGNHTQRTSGCRSPSPYQNENTTLGPAELAELHRHLIELRLQEEEQLLIR